MNLAERLEFIEAYGEIGPILDGLHQIATDRGRARESDIRGAKTHEELEAVVRGLDEARPAMLATYNATLRTAKSDVLSDLGLCQSGVHEMGIAVPLSMPMKMGANSIAEIDDSIKEMTVIASASGGLPLEYAKSIISYRVLESIHTKNFRRNSCLTELKISMFKYAVSAHVSQTNGEDSIGDEFTFASLAATDLVFRTTRFHADLACASCTARASSEYAEQMITFIRDKTAILKGEFDRLKNAHNAESEKLVAVG